MDEKIIEALENEYDGVDKFDLVAEILKQKKRINELKAGLRKIKTIEDAWDNCIPECDVCYEVQQVVEQALKG